MPGLWGFGRVCRMVQLLRFAVVVVLGGIATAGLSACSGAGSDGEPVSPSVSVVVSEAPSVSPTPTVTPEEELLARIPEEARYESFPSSVEFSMFFLSLYPRLFDKVPDTELFAYLTGENCGFCVNSLNGSQETVDAGAYSVGSEFTFEPDLARGGLQNDGYWYVALNFETSASTTFGPDGAQIESGPARSGEVRLRLEWNESHWLVDEIDFDIE